MMIDNNKIIIIRIIFASLKKILFWIIIINEQEVQGEPIIVGLPHNY